MSSSTVFTGGEADAVFLVGLRSAVPDKRSVYPSMNVEFVSLDAPPAGQKRYSFLLFAHINWEGRPSEGSDPEVDYRAVRIPPGRYAMSHTVQKGYFDGGPKTVRISQISTPNGMPVFAVKAGEVAYFGNFYLDGTGYPNRIIAHERDHEAALSYLKSRHPNVTQPMVDRTPEWSRGK